MKRDVAMNAALRKVPRRRPARRWLSMVLSAALTVLSLQVVSFVVAPAAHASGGAGTGGQFVPGGQRLLNQQSLSAGVWTAFQLLGAAGVPASNVEAVMITVTVYPSTAAGIVEVAPNTSIPSGPLPFLVHGAGERASTSGVVAPGTDGKIAIRASVSENVIVDVQGYFTVGNGTPAPGGFVPVTPTRIYGPSTWTNGLVRTLIVAGVGGVPYSASAALVNITVTDNNAGTAGGYVQAYAAGTSPGTTSLTYSAGTTSLSASVDLDSSGQMNLSAYAPSGNVTITVDVQGYFDGQPSMGGFTPLEARLYDSSQSPNVNLAPGASTTVTIGGVNGMPAASPTLSAFALNVEADTASTGTGSVTIWPDDVSQPSVATISYDNNSRQSNIAWIRPGATTGNVNIKNSGTATMRIALYAEGYMTTTGSLAPASNLRFQQSGARAGASPFGFKLTDQQQVQVNPANGNLLYTQSLFSLAGVGVSAGVQLRYNSINDLRPTLSNGFVEAELFRASNNQLTYQGADGGGYTFAEMGTFYNGLTASGTAATLYAYGAAQPGGGVTAGSPAGINATLVRVGAGYGPGTEYDLTFHPSQVTNVYHDNGVNVTLDSTQDATGTNKITYTYANNLLTSQTDSQGRTISYVYGNTNNPTQASTITDNSLSRAVHFFYDGPAGAMSKVADATGAVTQFGYDSNNRLATITDPLGIVTTIGYDTSRRATSLERAATTGIANVDVTWHLGYTAAACSVTDASTGATVTKGSACTTITDPNTHAWSYAVTAAPTTYTSGNVTAVLDPLGHGTSSNWDVHNELTDATTQLQDETSYSYDTTSNTYNMLKASSPNPVQGSGNTTNGRVSTFTYGAAPANGTYLATPDYRPSSETDSNSSRTDFTYNSWGEVSSRTEGSGTADAATYKSFYQGDTGVSCGGKTGQLCQTTDPLNHATVYAYNAAGDLTGITPPSPLGATTLTHDAAGRVISVHDGRGTTKYTCYDADDRVVQVSTTSSNCTVASGVTYTFDADGNLTKRQSTVLTTTIGYDKQNRPATQTESNGTSTSYTYDGASNMLTYTDPGGATTYSYDTANRLTKLALPGNTCPGSKCVTYTYDDNNRRVDTTFGSGVTNHLHYDASSRIDDIQAHNSSGTVLANRHYNRANPTIVGGDFGLITKITDSTHTAPDTVYNYDGRNRLVSLGPTTTSITATWAYDADSNIVHHTDTPGAINTYYGFNSADQTCWSAPSNGTGCTTPTGGTSYTYDANGNTTGDSTGTVNTWSPFNQLASTTTGGSPNYTYAGTTNTTRATAGSTTFTNSLTGWTSRSTGGLTATYIHEPGGALVAATQSTNTYYYTQDIIKSTILITDQNQTTIATYLYDPYGRTTVTPTTGFAATNPWRYASGYFDSQTGLVKLGARYYNPTLERFTQPDPSGQEPNRYAYAGGDPILNSDPNGLDDENSDYSDDSEDYSEPSCYYDGSGGGDCCRNEQRQLVDCTQSDWDNINEGAQQEDDLICGAVGLASFLIPIAIPAAVFCGIEEFLGDL